MKVLFIYWPSFVYFNHGSALLTAICKERGIDADYREIDKNFKQNIAKYDVVCFSFVTDLDYKASVFYLKIAKEAGKKVLVGGVYARRGGRIDKTYVDLICRGEAETIADYFLKGDETIFKTKYFHENLDDLPLPDLSHVTGYEFHRDQSFLFGQKIIPYQTSRGCPYRCSFCEVRYQPAKIRIKTRIKQDLEYLSSYYHPDMFYLMDAQPPYFIREWLEQWEDIYEPFQCFIRADIHPDVLEFLIDHGLTVTSFGVETANEKLRNNGMQKGLSNADIIRTVEILNRKNIVYVPFFMSGTPGETEEDRKETLEAMKRIGGLPILWKYEDLSESIDNENRAR